MESALGKRCKSAHAPTKEGEQLRSVLSFEKIRMTLGWKPSVALREGLAETINYFKEHPSV